MKVIDLLNNIANGEEVPKKIKYKSSIYNYREQRENKIYQFEDTHTVLTIQCFEELNEEVEIIEEDKKIEKLYKYIDKEVDEKEKDMYYENILKVYDDSEYEIDESMSFVVDKINEIIDYLGEKE